LFLIFSVTPNLCLWDESISAYVQLLVDGILDFSLSLIFAYSVLDSDGQLIEAAGRQSKGLSVPLLVGTRGTYRRYSTYPDVAGGGASPATVLYWFISRFLRAFLNLGGEQMCLITC
jgi:hypothetical protein